MHTEERGQQGDAVFGGLDLFIHKGNEFLSPAFYLLM
jgi:hypothetical protein